MSRIEGTNIGDSRLLLPPLIASQSRIMALLDRNPCSPTFGSFDRKYWQYRILDFPCGMQQELVLPLAWLYSNECKGNRFFGLPRIAQALEGVFRFQRICSHVDGSVDDYFPHERAFGATAYSLAALTEAALLLGRIPGGDEEILERNGAFLDGFRESGKLSNHFAIAAAALGNLAVLTGRERWKQASDRLVEELRRIQHEEGWFPEYEGCDLGYQTVTVEFLARRYQRFPSPLLMDMMRRTVRFLHEFLHPDGSIGGEYGSRNTFNFYPGGFALLSGEMPEAASIFGAYLSSLEWETNNALVDDGVFGHLLSSHVIALSSPQAIVSRLEPPCKIAPPEVKVFPGCGFFVGKTGALRVFGSLDKGGVFKVYSGVELICSDTGHLVELEDGRRFCQNKPRSAFGRVEGNEVQIQGTMPRFKTPLLTRLHMIGLRLLSLAFGRWQAYSHLVRWAMQKVIVFDKSRSKVAFKRRIRILKDGIMVEDELENHESSGFERVWRTPDCVNTHVITSNSFQPGNLLSWEILPFFKGGRKVTSERWFRSGV